MSKIVDKFMNLKFRDFRYFRLRFIDLTNPLHGIFEIKNTICVPNFELFCLKVLISSTNIIKKEKKLNDDP